MRYACLKYTIALSATWLLIVPSEATTSFFQLATTAPAKCQQPNSSSLEPEHEGCDCYPPDVTANEVWEQTENNCVEYFPTDCGVGLGCAWKCVIETPEGQRATHRWTSGCVEDDPQNPTSCDCSAQIPAKHWAEQYCEDTNEDGTVDGNDAEQYRDGCQFGACKLSESCKWDDLNTPENEGTETPCWPKTLVDNWPHPWGG